MKKSTKIIIILFILIIIGTYSISLKLEVNEYTIKTNKIEQTIKPMVLSDLHSSDYGDESVELYEEIVEIDPDFILLPGDIIDDVKPGAETYMFLDNISKLYPTYYVTGNHEFWSNDIKTIKERLKQTKVNVLEGNCEILNINEDSINICGLDDAAGDTRNSQITNIQYGVKNDVYNILLNHRPNEIVELENLGFDLIVSGHAHGGQWRLPFSDLSAFAPDQGFLPKLTNGFYDNYNTKILVSRGLAKGTTGYIPRIFNRPEIVVVNIEKDNDEKI